MRLTVIGTGYLGAVHAACMAEIGHDVLGVDVDEAKIAALAEGRAPFFEPGFPEVLKRNLENGRLRFGTSLAEAGAFGDVHFVCVGTPQRPGSHAADLRYVDAVVGGLAPHLRPGALVVGKSTVPVGTAARLADSVPALAWNPEFLREGFAVEDTLRPDRLVVGVTSAADEDVLRAVYAPILAAGTPWVSTDPATAELVKVAANSFLATKISFINAMAEICEAAGADVTTLAGAIGYDARIGDRFLRAGVGFGGGCLPKDIRAFRHRAAELGLADSVRFLHEVDEINGRRRTRAVDLARELVGGSFAGTSVTVLGATFKPDSDDIRDSPALAVANAIRAEGAQVTVHDPQGIDNARAVYPDLDYSPKAQKACEGAHVVVLATEWAEYRELDPAAVREVVAAPALVDARNALDLPAWQEAGWDVRALGRSL
ncbi:UDP-glucose dehydrogenase family protein [Cryptosporangium arvum]|uniref:UDP-glucose 6-dehydrogenase n=1 Tax=Cryptosporangium arvum DSM 44712 TaxID=927661 RepID=A0A011AD41_9ACTN|nr:UDP-glucose/GDP-mannose dehydrogenase family protein [Cryptosporangium arvum]EXG79971.1 nucleotide sugar dehydrogenase [Cryptosporangium arvum DSM 44712]